MRLSVGVKTCTVPDLLNRKTKTSRSIANILNAIQSEHLFNNNWNTPVKDLL